MQIQYPEIGICGLSCRLCPSYHARGGSKCGGCKSKYRMAAGCPFITCAVKRKGIEFCWDCDESEGCERWRVHRAAGLQYDSFVCYQRLADNINFILENGVRAFEKSQKTRERLLREMLDGFNEGRSKTYYSIAATVMETAELKTALSQARQESAGMDVREKSRLLHARLDNVAESQGYHLKLRKYKL